MNEEPLKVRVEVEIRTPHAADLEKAISVDNVDVPQGIAISVYHNEENLYIIGECECVEPKRLLTLRNTLDDILVDINAAIKVLETVK